MTKHAECERDAAGVRSPTLVRLQRLIGERDGDSLIEMAIALPTFFMMLFGICAFAMVLTSWCSATYAVRVGTRFASLHSASSTVPASVTQVTNLVNSQLFMPGASTPNITVTYYQFTAPALGNYVGGVVEVAITWNQTLKVPYYSKALSLQSLDYRLISR